MDFIMGKHQNENINITEKKETEKDDYYTYSEENNVKKTKGVVGLYNLGNTCYMNSLLQCLKNLYPLTEYIFEKEFTNGNLIISYKQLLCNLISTKNEITDACDYHKDLGKIDSYFDSNDQRDSSRLLLTHIKVLMDDTKNYVYYSSLDPLIKKEEPKFYNNYMNSKKRNPSKIYDLFFGYSKTIIKCKNCNKTINEIYQPFSLINLYLKDKEGKKIKCLKELIANFEREKITTKLCECGSNLIQQTILSRLPPILVFKFERVVNGRHINHKINYDINLEMKDYSDGFIDNNNNLINPIRNFTLVGVMLHYGNAFGGHKTSYTKNFIDDKWYYFNDSSKREVNKSYVLNDNEAFMLFYISDSCKISNVTKKEIQNYAEKKSTYCNYYSERYSFLYNKINNSNYGHIYNYNNNFNNISTLNSLNNNIIISVNRLNNNISNSNSTALQNKKCLSYDFRKKMEVIK